VRSIFSQYSQPENRLTHALACTLTHDRKLLRPFLRWIGLRNVPPLGALRIVEQQVPGEIVSGDEAESAGVPDLCVFNRDSWAVVFEAKVQSRVYVDQLKRHRRTAECHGYPQAPIVVLAVDPPSGAMADVVHIQWRELWAWFRRRAAESFWAQQMVEYMQAFEKEMISQNYGIRGTLTMFDGLRFDEENPYTYSEGKRLIRLLGDELQRRTALHALGVDPKGPRRSAITGRGGDRVWDFLPLRVARHAGQFTHYPHLTLDIGRDNASAAITVPNGVKGGFRSKVRRVGSEGFSDILLETLDGLRPVLDRSKGARANAYALQRHYPSQRAAGIIDGRISVDLETLVRKKSKSGVKYQPQWIDAIYTLLAQKRSNIQFGVTVAFDYRCPIVRSPKAADLFADAWLGMEPVLDFVLSD
jgi:hypothetical protein